MNNPRDFIPAKYKKNQTKEIDAESVDFQSAPIDFQRNEKAKETIDSPWSDLAKEPEIPEYRNTSDFGEEKIDNYKQTSDVVPTLSNSSSVADSLSLEDNSPIAANLANNFKPKKKSNTKLAGLLVVFFLIVGIFSSYLLSKQNQDNRQQASTGDPYSCNSGDANCSCAYNGSSLECRKVSLTPTVTPETETCNTPSANCECKYNGSSLDCHRVTPTCKSGDANCECKYNGSSLECKPITTCKSGDANCECKYNGSSLECKPSPNSCGSNMHEIDGNCVHETCRKLANGNTICGFFSDKDPCTEESLGGDWCDNPNTSKVETCEEAGLMRCQCSGKWWTIGKGESCDALCEDANVNCPTCDDGGDDDDDNPTPTPPPQPLACGEFNCIQNSDCQNGLTCQSVTVGEESKKICSKGENQLFCAADPTTDNCCVSQAMPVCASIEMLDTNNNLMTGDADKNLSIGDGVRFRCSAVGNQLVLYNNLDVDFDYQFRIWDKSTTSWVNITDNSNTVAKNISALYTINSFSKHVVQGRICWGSECQVWEIVEGAPNISNTTSSQCYGNNAVACEKGYICSATPAGGCPAGSTCASAPFCRRAEGISCATNSDCFEGYTCYQPPMPACPTGMSCAQVMPDKYCTKQ